MSTKDFKQGMVAGAKPFGDKLDQLANVSEKAVSDIREGVDGINEVVNIVLDDLSAQEKKRIYDLDEATDISILEDEEKEFLVAVLSELANSIPVVTDLQRKYIISVCSTVGIAAPQSSLNLACIENIDNMRTQKILLRHVMEFMFIGNQNYDFLDDYEDLIFCYFSVNKRGINEIITTIDRVYTAMGVDGLSNRYTFVSGYEELIEDDISDGGDDGDENREGEIIDPSTYENLDLTGIISVQAPMEYRAKNIRLDAIFSVNNELVFKNCTICFTSSASFNVTGAITFKNCEITCVTEREKENYIISTLDDSKLVIHNCVLHNIRWFAKTQGDVDIDKCTFAKSSAVVYANSETGQSHFNISNSLISINDSNDWGFIIGGYAGFTANNLQTSWNKLPTKKTYYGLFQISANEGVISNCELNNIEIAYSSHICLEKCTINNSKCYNIKGLSNCKIECSEIYAELIDNCEFVNMNEVKVTARNISNSIFDNVFNTEQEFISLTSRIDNCIFSNINMETGFPLIFASIGYGLGDKKPDVYITNCRFINCYTERSDKKLIAGLETKFGLFSDKKTSYEPICRNCFGLNDVRSGKFIEQKMQETGKMSTGAKIGAGIGAIIAGPLGALGGSLLGKKIADTSDFKKNDIKKTFELVVEEVFNIRMDDNNLYPVVIGIIEFGNIHLNDRVTVTNSEDKSFETEISGIEVGGSLVDEAKKGDNVGILFKKCNKSDFSEGDIITK